MESTCVPGPYRFAHPFLVGLAGCRVENKRNGVNKKKEVLNPRHPESQEKKRLSVSDGEDINWKTLDRFKNERVKGTRICPCLQTVDLLSPGCHWAFMFLKKKTKRKPNGREGL